VKDENCDLIADSHKILSRGKELLLSVHRVSNVRQIEIHTTESLIPDPSLFVVKIAIAKLKSYKLPGSDQILTELIQAGGEILQSEIHKLINSVQNEKELSDQ
jgi:hypothetical protein